ASRAFGRCEELLQRRIRSAHGRAITAAVNLASLDGEVERGQRLRACLRGFLFDVGAAIGVWNRIRIQQLGAERTLKDVAIETCWKVALRRVDRKIRNVRLVRIDQIDKPEIRRLRVANLLQKNRQKTIGRE